MRPHLIKYASLGKPGDKGILSLFAIVDDSSGSPICCCAECTQDVLDPDPDDTSPPGTEYISFFEKLHKYYDRFQQEPTFELAKSLFDDRFKNTVTSSE